MTSISYLLETLLYCRTFRVIIVMLNDLSVTRHQCSFKKLLHILIPANCQLFINPLFFLSFFKLTHICLWVTVCTLATSPSWFPLWSWKATCVYGWLPSASTKFVSPSAPTQSWKCAPKAWARRRKRYGWVWHFFVAVQGMEIHLLKLFCACQSAVWNKPPCGAVNILSC